MLHMAGLEQGESTSFSYGATVLQRFPRCSSCQQNDPTSGGGGRKKRASKRKKKQGPLHATRARSMSTDTPKTAQYTKKDNNSNTYHRQPPACGQATLG